MENRISLDSIMESFSAEIRKLQNENESLKKQLNENAILDTSKDGNIINGKRIVLGINDLLKRNEEAVHDALTYFQKKCPYCGVDLFSTNIRQKIEIDHFFPINRGGQDVPWNLLPVCKACNRKKSDKLPYDVINKEVFIKCNSYLANVKEKYLKQGIDSYLIKETLISEIDNNIEFIIRNINEPLIKILVSSIYPEKLNTIIMRRNNNIDISYEIDIGRNGVKEFIEKSIRIRDGFGGYIGATALYNKYLEWAKRNNKIKVTQTAFGREMSIAGFHSTRGRDGKRGYYRISVID